MSVKTGSKLTHSLLDLPSLVPVAAAVLVPEPSVEAADSDEQLPHKFEGKLPLSILPFATLPLVRQVKVLSTSTLLCVMPRHN